MTLNTPLKLTDEQLAAMMPKAGKRDLYVPVVDARDVVIKQLQAENAQLQAKLSAGDEKIESLSRQVAWLTRQMFGRKSERFSDDAETGLFGLDQPVEDPPAPEPQTQTITRQTPRRGKRPNLADADLPETVLIQEPEDIDLSQYKYIGDDISYYLEFEPGKLSKVKVVRRKYAPLSGEGEFIVGPGVDLPIPKGVAGPGLLAMITMSKFADHLPLYRQEKMFGRLDQWISRSSMSRWLIQLSDLCLPLMRLLADRICLSHCIQADETTVTEQDKKKLSYFWSYCGDSSQPYVVYDYCPDRSRAGPNQWFLNPRNEPRFQGYLQCDGYSGYTDLWQAPYGMTHVGCWAHARRKFHDLRQKHYTKVQHALSWIKILYEVESHATKEGMTPQERQALRVEKSVPVVDAFFAWCKKENLTASRKVGMGQAMQYCLNLETDLRRYLADGQLQIDNNACERTMRGIALGRKNWLFVGNDAGGQAAATMFSLIASCQRSGVNEWDYLKDLFSRLPRALTSERQLEQFLPDRWKLEQQES